jgi:hypothetical protein
LKIGSSVPLWVGVTLRLPTVRQVLIAALTAVALAATAIAWARVVHTISNARPPSSPLTATSVVWGDRVFPSPPALTGWLHAHGASYIGWSRRHPSAAARLDHRAPPVVPAATRQGETVTVTSTVVTAAAPKTRRLASSSSKSGFPLETFLVTLLAVLAAVCIWASTLPSVLRDRFPELTRWIAGHRDLVVAGGAALVIGVVAGVALN